jgi:hypothetical protein
MVLLLRRKAAKRRKTHMNSDANLVKIVWQERHNRKDGTALRTVATLTRFGGLAVFVNDEKSGETVWQGENILQARSWIRGEVLTPQSPEFRRFGDARNTGDLPDFWIV